MSHVSTSSGSLLLPSLPDRPRVPYSRPAFFLEFLEIGEYLRMRHHFVSGRLIPVHGRKDTYATWTALRAVLFLLTHPENSVRVLRMLVIRLQRVGRKNDPSFRVVVTRSTNGPKSGKFLEIVGNHNPRTDVTALNTERIKHWISVGAQPSDTMHNLLISKKIIEGKKVNVLPRKSPIKKEGEATAPATPEAATATEAAPAEAQKSE